MGSVAQELAARLSQIVLAKIEQDKLSLPSMPEVAMRCLELVRNPNLRLRDLSNEVEKDPILTAYVLRVANSAALGGSGGAQALPQAITRLGAKQLKQIFITVSAKQLFQSRDNRITKAFKSIWRHSVATGVLSRDIAALMGGVDADMAYQAGLLHDIGKPIFAMMMLEAEKQLASGRGINWINHEEWMGAVQGVHRPIAVRLSEKWSMHAEVQKAIANCTDYDASDRKAVSNVVRFANAITKQINMYVGDFDRDEVDTLVMVGRSLIGIDDNVVEKLSSNLSERIDEMVS